MPGTFYDEMADQWGDEDPRGPATESDDPRWEPRPSGPPPWYWSLLGSTAPQDEEPF